MKEMERIAIKKIHRIANEQYQKYLNSLSDESREELLSKIDDSLKKELEISSFDLHIEKYYDEMNGCSHEYGITNNSDEFMGRKCVCLDCGEYLDEKNFQKVFFVNSNESLLNIRNYYIENLMNNSVSDSFVSLKRKYSIK